MRWVILISALVFLGCGKEVALSGLDEISANRALVALYKAGLKAKKVGKAANFDIVVAKNDLPKALEVLASRRFSLQLEGGFKKSSRPSEEEERFMYERLLARELEKTLERLPDVELARVHLYLPKYQSLSMKKLEMEHAKSSVVILAYGKNVVEEGFVKRLIEGATGIKPEQILVDVQVVEESNQLSSTQLNTREETAGLDLKKESTGFFNFSLSQLAYPFLGALTIGLALYAFTRVKKI